ncbi:MAG: hypothetical protein AB7F76_01715 [Parvibaculaceae bacterium]|jgi:hypothetical protein
MHRRLFLASTLSVLLPLPAFAESEKDVRRKLVGVWAWEGTVNGRPTDNRMALRGSGRFTYTQSDRMGHSVTQSGRWHYESGWLTFKVTWSNVRVNGRYIQLGPIRILHVGKDHVRTPQGIAIRVG